MASRSANSTSPTASVSTPTLTPINTPRRLLARHPLLRNSRAHEPSPKLCASSSSCASDFSSPANERRASSSAVEASLFGPARIGAHQPQPALEILAVLLQPLGEARDHLLDELLARLRRHGLERRRPRAADAAAAVAVELGDRRSSSALIEQRRATAPASRRRRSAAWYSVGRAGEIAVLLLGERKPDLRLDRLRVELAAAWRRPGAPARPPRRSRGGSLRGEAGKPLRRLAQKPHGAREGVGRLLETPMRR